MRRRRRPLLKLVLGLAIFGVVFGTVAVGTLWLIETTQFLSAATSAGKVSEDFSSEERRALDQVIDEGAPTNP